MAATAAICAFCITKMQIRPVSNIQNNRNTFYNEVALSDKQECPTQCQYTSERFLLGFVAGNVAMFHIMFVLGILSASGLPKKFSKDKLVIHVLSMLLGFLLATCCYVNMYMSE